MAVAVSFRLPLGNRADVWVGDPLGRELLRGPTRFLARMLATLRAAQSDVIRVTTHDRAYLAWYARYLDSTQAPKSLMPLRIWADSFLGGATDGQRFYAHPYNHNTANSHHITKLEWLNVLPVVCVLHQPTSVAAFTSSRAGDVVVATCTHTM